MSVVLDKFIHCENITKVYHGRVQEKIALSNVNFSLQYGEKIGILGHNGAGKSTLIRILSGAEQPTSGRINRTMSLSWPLAFHGGFHSSLTGADNIRFLSRIYDKEFKEVFDFVAEFSELGKDLYEPFRTYSSGMAAKLAFGLTLALDFDCLLVDEILSVGDIRFQEKCRGYILGSYQDKSMILVSHHADVIRDYCTKACVLHHGVMFQTEEIERALHDYDGLIHENLNKQIQI